MVTRVSCACRMKVCRRSRLHPCKYICSNLIHVNRKA